MFRMNYDLMKSTSLTSSWKIEKKIKKHHQQKGKKKTLALLQVSPMQKVFIENKNQLMAFKMHAIALSSIFLP